MSDTRSLAVFGGTFDPVHKGHLASALAIRELLGVETVALVPCQVPPHRETPAADSEKRLKMLELAVSGTPGVVVDNRELTREGKSFTYDTLASYRDELDTETSLIFVLGLDAYITLPSWYRWKELCDLAHLLVLKRPGASEDLIPEELENWARGKECNDAKDLIETPAGKICTVSLVQVPVSATEIREKCRKKESIKALVPDEVNRYIKAEQLYLNNS